MTTFINMSFLILFLTIAMLSLFWVIGKTYMDNAARVILSSVGFLSWIAIGFWLLDGSVMVTWGLTSTDFAYTFMQWLPFFLAIVPVTVSINRWGKVRQTNPFGKGGTFENFDYKPKNTVSGYDGYKEQLRARLGRR